MVLSSISQVPVVQSSGVRKKREKREKCAREKLEKRGVFCELESRTTLNHEVLHFKIKSVSSSLQQA